MAYSAVVNDGEPHEVDLEYDPVEGWSGNCTCEREFDCQHIFATMRALLAEHSTAAVRNLSAGVSTASGGWNKATSKAEDDSAGLARRLMATLGRSLNAEETKFVRKVHNVYLRCQQTRHITHWDFTDLGFRLNGYGWEGIHIWPAFPNDEHEFWLYVANAVTQQGLTFPEFMEPITDLNGVQDRLARWRRTQEVEKWKQTLGNLHSTSVSLLTPQGETDLHLVIGKKEAFLQWRRPPQENFQAIKTAQMNQLANDYREGQVQFTKEAELIWHLFSPGLYAGAPQLRYY